MDVEHVHENAEPQPRLRSHGELGRGNSVADRKQLTVSGTDDQSRPLGRDALGITEEGETPERERRKREGGPRRKQKQEEIDREEQGNEAPTVAMNGNSQICFDPVVASVYLVVLP